MDNDFNYKPQSGAPESASSEPTSDPAPEAPSHTDTPTSPQIVTSGSGKPKAFKRLLAYLGIVLLLAAVGYGVYYWQQAQVKQATAAKSSAEQQLALFKAQVATVKGSPAKSTETQAAKPPTVELVIVTGEVSTKTSTGASVAALYQFNQFDDLWVEYGTAPNTLSQTVPHFKTETGPTSSTAYSNHSFALTGLKANTTYFYRAVGQKGTTMLYGGVASFTTAK